MPVRWEPRCWLPINLNKGKAGSAASRGGRVLLKLPENFQTYSEARQQGFMRMKALKEQGKKVVGIFCTYTPVEMVLAAGAVPVSLCGAVISRSPMRKRPCPRIYAH
jgi:hypothetical protein